MKFIEPLVSNYPALTKSITQQTVRATIADNLTDGGTTPSKGMIAESTVYAHDHQLSLTIMIRPRGGDSVYSDPELKIMEADALDAQQLGADGIIVSALTADGQVDTEAMANLIAAAGGMSVTFGTAVDELNDAQLADNLKWLADNGVEKVLTKPASQPDLARLSKLNNIVGAAGMQLIVWTSSDTQPDQLNEQLGLNYFLQPQK
ncbi:copper homeostasis protein CutC [Secundilactobacillus folii]|uniref:copper homeostasis protein CutC n=1 Tax=Secundilactobacillus folii TaxID=2678357 RepID=UPI001FEB3306|nr:copper homeostasis protein CutC [Secundilactobacillus folii]